MDSALFAAINSLAGHWHGLDLLMIALANDSVVVFALYLLLLWFVPGPAADHRRRRLLALRALLTAALGLAVAGVIGRIVGRPRPFVAEPGARRLIAHAPDNSFPSDHGTLETALTYGLRRAGPVVFPLFGLLTLLTMVARVYVGVHYPGDMVGACLVGLGSGLLVDFAWPWLEPWLLRLIGVWEWIARRLGSDRGRTPTRQN